MFHTSARSESRVVLEVTTSGIDQSRALPQLQFDCNPFRFVGRGAFLCCYVMMGGGR